MLKKLISEIVDPLLGTINPNWVDRYGGLVQTLEVKKAIDPNSPTKTQIQKYPISCSVTQEDCNEPNSIYADLVPDESKSSIVYWEELSPMKFAGFLKQDSQIHKNYQKWTGKARLVVWLNGAKLGIGAQNDNYSCDWYFPFLDQLTSLLTTSGKLTSGDMEGGDYTIQPVNLAPKDISIFNKYTYDKYLNYYRYPYDCFAIDFEFSIMYCVGSNSVIPTGVAIPCPFNQVEDPVFNNEYSMLFDGINEYLVAPNDSSLIFTDGVNDTPFTISFWLYPLAGSGLYVLVNKLNSKTTIGDQEYQLSYSNYNIYITLFDKTSIGGTVLIGTNTNGSLPINDWTNVVVTYDGSGVASGLNIYYDGVLQATSDYSNGSYTSMPVTNSMLTIGKAAWRDDNYLDGNLEELAMFNAELNLSEITELYNSGLPTDLNDHSKAANLVLWSRMGDNDFWDGFNWQLYDNSTNNNTLESVNMEEGDRDTNIPT